MSWLKRIDALNYNQVKQASPDVYEMICAFASTFGSPGEDIDVCTRYQVERFCMDLAVRTLNQH